MPSLEAIREKDPAQIAVLEREVAALPPVKLEPDCATCGDARFVLTGPVHRERVSDMKSNGIYQPIRDVEPCPACNIPDPLDLVKSNGIPARYREATFETFRPDAGKAEALKAMQTWVGNVLEGGTASVLLRGGPGRGKTHLACASLLNLNLEGVAGIFIQASDLLARLKAGFDDGTSEAVERTVANSRVLVLDDIAAARPTEWARDRISALIEHRLTHNFPTVITSDKNAAELLARGYDDRVTSRLRLYDVVRIEGDDMRGAS